MGKVDLMSILTHRPDVLSGLGKKAFEPMPGGPMPAPAPPMPPAGAPMPGAPMPAPGGMPMDPAAAGMPPVDPMAGMPVDPATGMPVDPATGMPIDPTTGMPMDPAAMGMPAGPVVGDLSIDEFKQMIREVVADVITGGKGDDSLSDKKPTEMGALKEQVQAIMDALGIGAGAEAPVMGEGGAGAPPPGVMGMGAGAPAAPAPMPMEQQASAHNQQKWGLADMIIGRTKTTGAQ